jgi:hypothetical protein
MDNQIDAMARTLAGATSRRMALRRIGVGTLGAALLATLGARTAGAQNPFPFRPRVPRRAVQTCFEGTPVVLPTGETICVSDVDGGGMGDACAQCIQQLMDVDISLAEATEICTQLSLCQAIRPPGGDRPGSSQPPSIPNPDFPTA